MLPNHAPLVVAEQFALLEAAYPGRIDLGIGRAPGTDPVTQLRAAARRRRRQRRGGHPLPGVRRQRAGDDGARRGRPLGRRPHPPARATPVATSVPTIWLLGSSDYSARLAAEKGMPYVFAHHFSGQGTAEALELYRSTFRPSPELAEPRTFLTVNAAVAATAGGGRAPGPAPAARDGGLRTGADARRRSAWSRRPRRWSCPRRTATCSTRCASRWVIGTPDERPRAARELAATYAVDEVMVHPWPAPTRAPSRGSSPCPRGDPAPAGGLTELRIRVSRAVDH